MSQSVTVTRQKTGLTVTDLDIRNRLIGSSKSATIYRARFTCWFVGKYPNLSQVRQNGTRHLLTGGTNIMSPRHVRQGVSHEHFHEVPGHVQHHLADGSPRIAKVRPRDAFDTLGCAPLLPSMIAHPSVHGQSVPAIC